MGSQGSKAAGGDPDTAKANGQENGHVISNGDMTPKAGVEATPQNGNGSAEPPGEESRGQAGAADAIEPAPAAADGAEPKGEGEGAATPKDAPKKKKKFSFKKPFKLSGISFRKNKKEGGDSCGSSPTEEERAKSEETPPGALRPSAPPEEGPGEAEGGGEASGNQEEEEEEEEKQQQGGESHGDTAKGQEPSEGAGPELAASPEQKEE